jgi:Tfp pilus assembly protein PilX
MSRAPRQEGFAMVSAIMILAVLIGLGLGLLLLTDNQQRAATGEQSRESAYALAEAALNAQIFELAQNWPTAATASANRPEGCTEASSTSTNDCPDPGSLSVGAGYPVAGACVGTEAWGSQLSNRWTTYVRADGGGTQQLFSSATNRTQPAYDNGDRSLWVRAVGVANCRAVSVISKVAEQLIPLTFPRAVLSANGFRIETSGKKVIVDTSGAYAEPPTIRPGPTAQPAEVNVRCEGLTEPECKHYTTGQVSPNTIKTGGSTPALTSAQIEGLKTQAKANGTYFKTGECPSSSIAELSGSPAYVEGPCALKFNGGTGNSKESPGFLVLYNGTLELGGNATFYGIVYAVNAQNVSGTPPASNVVKLSGNSEVQGAVDIDGKGTVALGNSHTNLVYDARGFNNVKAYGGVAATPNTFRVLPSGQ